MVKLGDYDGGASSGLDRIDIWKQDTSANWTILGSLGTSSSANFTLQAGEMNPATGDVHFFLTRYDPTEVQTRARFGLCGKAMRSAD